MYHQQPHYSYAYDASKGNNPEDETAGWDHTSYFGTEATGGDAGGAGGFNWWEAN